MNYWECDYRDPGHGARCNSKAMGLGGAIGLVAIGWYFDRHNLNEMGTGILLCPAHRPDKIPCKLVDSKLNELCSYCKAEAKANYFQEILILDGRIWPLDG